MKEDKKLSAGEKIVDLRIKLTALALVNLKGRVKLEKEIEMKENSSPREKRH
ncbi:MAG: hypothetical protein IPP89_19195 [Saprospiraceae bacterium]|nr:hypothetical protein [Candidatus Brachybacter algidus]MBK9396139.1 hypothetical protein [Candidatus Brachybacter algidus]MBL0121029.1 hypothetical protein [Candidatus Brachybacter algidus]